MADEELTEQEKMDRMVAELSADIEGINEKEQEAQKEEADEELTEQEKMDRMVAELSADIEGINEKEQDDQQETENLPVGEEETKEKEKDLEKEVKDAEKKETDEELTEQEKMDRMVAELSTDIEGINNEKEQDDQQETENLPVGEEETKEKEKDLEKEVKDAEKKEVDEELTEQEKMDRMVAELSADIEGINEKEQDDQQETENLPVGEEETKEKEKDLEKKEGPDKAALERENDEDKAEDLAIGPDSHERAPDEDEDTEDDESDEWKENELSEKNDHGGKKKKKAILWGVIAILVLGSSYAWVVYYKNINILEYVTSSHRVTKPMPKPEIKNAGDLDSELPVKPTPESQVKALQTSIPPSLVETVPAPLDKYGMFEQKMQQILTVRKKLSEKRTQAVSMREKLNEQILALKKEILTEKKRLGATSYKDAVKSPRIYHNIALIQQLKAYTSKLSERIRYYEDGYDKMGFYYQETDDSFKMIELWSDAKIEKLMAKIDKVIKGYQSVNRPHMFTNKQIVLEKPHMVWIEIIRSEMQKQ